MLLQCCATCWGLLARQGAVLPLLYWDCLWLQSAVLQMQAGLRQVLLLSSCVALINRQCHQVAEVQKECRHLCLSASSPLKSSLWIAAPHTAADVRGA